MAPSNTPATVNPERLYTVKEVAERFRLCQRSVWRLVAIGELKSIRIGQRSTRISESAIGDYLALAVSAR